MSSRNILLKGGVVLLHDAHNHVAPTKTDVLIEDSTITKIAQNIAAPNGANIIDCTHKIISPGYAFRDYLLSILY